MILCASGFFHPVKPVEDLLLVRIGYPDSVICDTDGKSSSCGQTAGEGRVAVRVMEIFDFRGKVFLITGKGQCDPAVFRCVADGVVKQDRDNLADPFRIDRIQRKCFFREPEGEQD